MFPELHTIQHKSETYNSEILGSYSELLSLGLGFDFPGFDLLSELEGGFLLLSEGNQPDPL